MGGVFCGTARLNLTARWVKLSLNEDLVDDGDGVGLGFDQLGEEVWGLSSVGVGGNAVFGAGR